MLESLPNLISAHSGTVVLVGVGSFFLLALTVLATPWILAKLPPDYFAKTPDTYQRSVRRVLLALVKTVLGFTLILTGFIMMVTPGPGLVFLVLGMALCELPGKHHLLQHLVRQPSVFATLNWLRERSNKAPFIMPPEKEL